MARALIRRPCVGCRAMALLRAVIAHLGQCDEVRELMMRRQCETGYYLGA